MQEADHIDNPDGLFLERLEAFMDKLLADVKTFAERESRPFEETRRLVAEWHAKFLFRKVVSNEVKQVRVRSALYDVSHTLESLHRVTGVHSFILAIDPFDPEDKGFLGGTTIGRSFWRGLRNGGDVGAKAFKLHCAKEQAPPGVQHPAPRQALAGATTPKVGPSGSLKNELYASVRSQLRSVSGVRNAEMKWTNHDRLGIYGIQLIGWPANIPLRNPSTLSVSQNTLLLDGFRNGTIRFSRIAASDVCSSASTSSEQGTDLTVDATVDAMTEEFMDFDYLEPEHISPSAVAVAPGPLSTTTDESHPTHSPSADDEDTGSRKRLRTEVEE